MKLYFILLIVFTNFISGATNYYIDSSAGKDINSGLSPQNAWRTIEKINYTKFFPGDSILFKRGEIFRGNLIAQGGTTTSPLVYGAYGTGLKPKIMGSTSRNKHEDWQYTGNSLWETSMINTEVSDEELLPNGSVSNNLLDWYSWGNTESGTQTSMLWTTKANEYYDSPAGLKIICINNGESIFDIQVFTNEWEVIESKWYKLTFFARATTAFSIESDDLYLMKTLSPYTQYSYKKHSEKLNFTNTWKEYEVYFRVNTSADDCRLTLFLGNAIPDNSTLFLDGLSLKECTADIEYLDVDVGNVILDNENICGIKKWDINELSAQGDFWYDANNQSLLMYSESNPADYYASIELAKSKHLIEYYDTGNTIFENLDLRYAGLHGINCIDGHDLTVRNVDFSFLGGGILSENSQNERLGNGIQFWDNTHEIVVEKCTFNEIYDAAISPQGSSTNEVIINRLFLRNNIISNCEYSFEFWERGDNVDLSEVYFENNTCLFAGSGWSHSQRTDPNGTHLMFFANDAACSEFYIRNNIFYQASDWGVRWTLLKNLKDAIIDYNCWYSETGALARVKDYIFEYEDDWESLKSTSGHAMHSLSEDPQMDENMLLSELSPCIGSGKVLQTVIDDYFGFSRSQSEGYDIGAVAAYNKITIENVEICNGESYKGLSQNGKYQQKYLTKEDKDSIVVSSLHVYPHPLPKIIVEEDTLRSNTEYISYQWYDDNGEIAGENKSELVINKSGNYYLEVIDDHGCKGTSKIVLVFLSGNEVLNENRIEFSILPNPNNGDFLVRFNSKQNKAFSIKIINTKGQIITSKQIPQTTTNQTVKLSIPNLNAGTYHLIVTSDNYRDNRKFIIY